MLFPRHRPCNSVASAAIVIVLVFTFILSPLASATDEAALPNEGFLHLPDANRDFGEAPSAPPFPSSVSISPAVDASAKLDDRTKEASPSSNVLRVDNPALTLSSPSGLPIPLLRHYTLDNVTRLANSTDEAVLAFFIQISNASLPLIHRLLSRIHHPANFYVLHFDRKIASHRVVTVVSTLRAHPAYHNVHFLSREPVTYRGVSMVLNNLAAVDRLLELGEWEYFINLSGADYPLVSPTNMRRILALPYLRERAANFFTASPQYQWKQAVLDRFTHVSIDPALAETTVSSAAATSADRPSNSHLLLLEAHSPLPSLHDFVTVKGEAWVILSRAAARFMSASAFSRKLLLAMALAQDPSEHFYASLLWNHPLLNRSVVPHSMRSIYWKINGVSSGQHPYTIDRMREANGEYILWEDLSISPHFFARKFDDPESPILDRIDNELNGLGEQADENSVTKSLLRVENHIHWLLGFLPEQQADRMRSDVSS